LEDDDLSTASSAGSSATQSPGWPYPTGDDERGAGRRAVLPDRSPSGRSPSGSVPPSTWSEPAGRGGDQAGYDRPARESSGGPYAGASGGSSPRASTAGGSGGSSPRASTAGGSGPSGPGPSSTAFSRARGDRDGYGDESGSRGERAGGRDRGER